MSFFCFTFNATLFSTFISESLLIFLTTVMFFYAKISLEKQKETSEIQTIPLKFSDQKKKNEGILKGQA